MSVSSIFKTLIIIVACVLIGAMILNVFLPNAVTSLSNAVEGSIYNATGMVFDFNGDGNGGDVNANTATGVDNAGAQTTNNAQDADQSNQVTGFN